MSRIQRHSHPPSRSISPFRRRHVPQLRTPSLLHQRESSLARREGAFILQKVPFSAVREKARLGGDGCCRGPGLSEPHIFSTTILAGTVTRVQRLPFPARPDSSSMTRHARRANDGSNLDHGCGSPLVGHCINARQVLYMTPDLRLYNTRHATLRVLDTPLVCR